METIFSHFLRQQSTATNGISFSFNQNILELMKRAFYLFFVYCFIPRFFLQVETIIEIRGSQFFKDEPYSWWWTQFFLIFWNKEEAVLRERVRSCQWTTDFLASGNFFFSFLERLLPVKSFISTSGNGLSGKWKPFCFVQRLFRQLETVKTIFLYFFRQQGKWKKMVAENGRKFFQLARKSVSIS